MKMTIVCRTSAELDQIKRYAESLGASVEKSLSAAPNEATGQFSLPTGAGAEHGAVILPFPGLAKDKIMTMDELEKQAITAAISSSGGNMTSAAKSLGIGRATLYRKIKTYDLAVLSPRSKKAA